MMWIIEEDNEKRLEMTEKLIYSYLEACYGEDLKKTHHGPKPEKENTETKAIRVSKRSKERGEGGKEK